MASKCCPTASFYPSTESTFCRRHHSLPPPLSCKKDALHAAERGTLPPRPKKRGRSGSSGTWRRRKRGRTEGGGGLKPKGNVVLILKRRLPSTAEPALTEFLSFLSLSRNSIWVEQLQ